jgi:hypothetical protein
MARRPSRVTTGPDHPARAPIGLLVPRSRAGRGPHACDNIGRHAA